MPVLIKLCYVTGYSVVTQVWGELTTTVLYAILKLRTDVFFVEQRVDEEELDGRDLEPTTVHYWIADETGRAIAYLRVLHDDVATYENAHRVLGRVVVRADHRGEGLAQLLMKKVVADFDGEPMVLHAQEYVAALYAKFGFVAFGEVYLEAGIRHISMYRP